MPSKSCPGSPRRPRQAQAGPDRPRQAPSSLSAPPLRLAATLRTRPGASRMGRGGVQNTAGHSTPRDIHDTPSHLTPAHDPASLTERGGRGGRDGRGGRGRQGRSGAAAPAIADAPAAASATSTEAAPRPSERRQQRGLRNTHRSGRFKSRLKTKCTRRRGESAVLFKNEHAVQARARWHVRRGRAGLGRRSKNIRFSLVSVKTRAAHKRELIFQNAHRA